MPEDAQITAYRGRAPVGSGDILRIMVLAIERIDKRGETEARSDWFTWETNKVRDTELALTPEAAGALSNS